MLLESKLLLSLYQACFDPVKLRAGLVSTRITNAGAQTLMRVSHLGDGFAGKLQSRLPPQDVE